MNLFELSAKISVDDSNFKKSMENAQNVSKNVATAIKNLQSPLDKAKSGFNAIVHPVETAKANIEKLKNATEAIRHPIEAFKNKVADASTALETKRNKLSALSAAYNSAKNKVADITKEFNKSAKESGTSSQKTQELAKKLNEAEKEAEEAKKELDDYSESVSKAGKNSNSASKGVGNFASKLGKGLATAGKIGGAAVGAVGSGIAALGTYAAKVGGDFEAQMSKVSAISGATGDDLQALEDKAKQLGIDTKFSATEAGQAFEYMAMAGWKTEQMLDGVAGIMDLAAASGEDLASVSDIVTDAMTAFGLSADQSTHFADVLAKASSNANTNVSLMGETFKYVAPVAGAMGFSVEDTATAIGLMANAGIKGSQAGTALRAMFSRLAKPTDEVATAMKTLNLSITNSDGSMRELDDIMADLRNGFDGLTEAEQTQIASQLAGQEAMSGLLAIVNTSEAEYNKLADAVNNADGAAKNMAATMANNLQGQLTLLKSSAEGFGLALYDKIQVPLTEMASWAVESLNQLTTAFNENGVDGVVEAAGNILSEAITTVVDKLPEFVELAVSVIESFVNALSEDQETIANGAISIITILATGILNMLPQIVELGLDLIVSLANGIAESLPELIPTIVDVVLQIVETLIDNVDQLIDAAIEIITALAEGIINALPTLIEKAPEIVGKLVDAVIENAPKLLDAAFEIITTLASGIVDNFPKIVEKGREIIEKIISGIGELFNKLVQKGKDIIDEVKSGIKKKIDNAKQWGKDLIQNFLDGITAKWNALKEKVSSVAQTVKNFLGFSEPKEGPLSNFHTYAPDMMNLFAKGIRDNENVITDQIEKSFDFGERTIKFGAEYGDRFGVASATRATAGGTSIGNVTINIDGAKYSNENSLAEAIAEALQNMTDRRAAVYA